MKSVRLVQLGHPLQDIEVAAPEIGPADVAREGVRSLGALRRLGMTAPQSEH